MIPQFPQFKNLELSDRAEIEKITDQFPPHSDFHFISIFCWDVDNTTMISVLNDNLIIRQIDCLTGEKFFSLIGNKKIPDTIHIMGEYMKSSNLPSVLRWVPEETMLCLDGIKATIAEDRDYFDYIYDVEQLYHAKGGKYKSYRHDIAQFKRTYPHIRCEVIDLKDQKVQKKVFSLYKKWLEAKGPEYTCNGTDTELSALKKLIAFSQHFGSIYSLGVFDVEQLIGFSIEDLENQKYGCGLFWKADVGYSGIYQFIMQQICSYYLKNKIPFMNFESDLGIDTIKQSKMNYNPVFFLKRYKIEIN